MLCLEVKCHHLRKEMLIFLAQELSIEKHTNTA